MAEPLLRACFRVGVSRSALRLVCLLVGSGAWLTATAGAASTQAVTYDLVGNPVTLASGTTVAAPVIVSGPVGRLARPGETVTFSVVARGTPPLTYRWRFKNTDISNADNPTADNPTLIISKIVSTDYGAYSVAVTNSAGTAVSSPAALQLDSVGDGIPNSWKIANFGAGWATDPMSAANADPDNDGFTNAEEYADGTDPNAVASHFYRLTVYGDALAQPSAPRYAPGTVVKLTAQPSGGRQFDSWTITDLVANTSTTSTVNPLTLTLNTNYAVTLLYATVPLAQVGTPPAFTVNNHNARAEVFLVQKSNNKLLIGGTFDVIGGTVHVGLARYNTDGTVDNAFNPTFDSTVVALAQQADGKILVGGYFGVVNGVYRAYLARLNLDGTLDTTFNPPATINNFVRSIQVRTGDTRILVAGNFGGGSTNSSGVAMLNADGSLDNTFATGTGANSTVYDAVWQSNGKVVIGGDFTAFNSANVTRLARLNANGSVDASFVGSADSTVYQIALRTDGDYVVGGYFGTIDGVARRGIARLKAADGGFVAANNVGVGLVNSGINGTGLVLQSDNKAIIGGSFSGVNTSTQAYVARINSDGSTDTTYTLGASATGVDNAVYGVGLDASGNALIGGPFNFINGVAHLGVARLKAANGNLDAAYTVNASYYSLVRDIAAMPDGRMIVGGDFNVVNGAYRPYVARLKVDGSLDTAFNAGTGPNDAVYAIALTPDGKALIGGNFTTVNGLPAGRVARFNANGSGDAGFSVAGTTDSQVSTLAVQRDGKVVVGGYFSQFNGAQRRYIARINANGTLDDSFSPAFDNRVASLAVQNDAKIVVGGFFANFNGSATGNLVRLNPDGTLDTNFTLQMPNDGVDSIVLQPDGKILFGGYFTVLQGSNMLAYRLARLNANGTVDPAFRIGTGYGYDGSVYQIGLQPDGKIISVGNYSTASGLLASKGLPRLRADGSADTLLGSNAINNAVYTIDTRTDNSVVIGGPFTKVNGLPRPAFARYVAQTTITPGGITVSPAGPTFATGASVTFSITPTAAAGSSIGGVTFESSADGVHFSTLGTANSITNGTFSLTTTLPPGASYVRALVTNTLANVAHSYAVGPFTTPPVATGALTATGTVGVPYSFQARATNPLTGYTATGLPAWATAVFDPNLGALVISGTPTVAGTTTVTLKPVNAAGPGTGTLTITITSSLNAWTAKNFSPAELGNARVSGPSGDATGAGIANLLKYALRIPPHEPGLSSALPRVSPQKDGKNTYLTLTYTRDKSAAEVVLIVQVSSELDQGWASGPGHTVEVRRTDNGDGTETIVTRDTVPLTGGVHRFIRLQATQINP